MTNVNSRALRIIRLSELFVFQKPDQFYCLNDCKITELAKNQFSIQTISAL